MKRKGIIQSQMFLVISDMYMKFVQQIIIPNAMLCRLGVVIGKFWGGLPSEDVE